MIVISGFTCPPTIHFKFITKCDGLFHYKVLWSVITKCDKCYYKVRQVLQSTTEQCSGSKDGKPAFHPYRYH